MNIVFDFGGVLLDWNPPALIERMLPPSAPMRSPADWVTLIFEGFGGDWAQFDRGTLTAAALAQRIAARSGLSAEQALRIVQAVPRELQPAAAMMNLLHRLTQRGHRLLFLSNMPLPYVEFLEENHGFLSLFSDGVFSSRVGMIKPEAEIFEHCGRRFELDGSDLLFIDDVQANVEAARRCGWPALRFQTAAQCADALRAAGAV